MHTHRRQERFSRAGPRGRGREWATLGEHPLTWLLSNNRLEKVLFVSVLHTSSNRLLLSNQDKECTPSVAHSLPLPLGPALLNLWTVHRWRRARRISQWQTHSLSFWASRWAFLHRPTANCNRGLAVAYMYILIFLCDNRQKMLPPMYFPLMAKNTDIIFILTILSINGILWIFVTTC